MIRVLDCTVSGGVVTAFDLLGVPRVVPDAIIQSMGVKPSVGKLIISNDGAVYITNTQPDLMLIIQKLSIIVDKVGVLSDTMVSRTPDSSPLNPAISAEMKAISAELKGFQLL